MFPSLSLQLSVHIQLPQPFQPFPLFSSDFLKILRNDYLKMKKLYTVYLSTLNLQTNTIQYVCAHVAYTEIIITISLATHFHHYHHHLLPLSTNLPANNTFLIHQRCVSSIPPPTSSTLRTSSILSTFPPA